MPGIFSRISKARDARQKKKHALNDLTNSLPAKPTWDDAYTRKSVDPEEIAELLRCLTEEIKTRGMVHFFFFFFFFGIFSSRRNRCLLIPPRARRTRPPVPSPAISTDLRSERRSYLCSQLFRSQPQAARRGSVAGASPRRANGKICVLAPGLPLSLTSLVCRFSLALRNGAGADCRAVSSRGMPTSYSKLASLVCHPVSP